MIRRPIDTTYREGLEEPFGCTICPSINFKSWMGLRHHMAYAHHEDISTLLTIPKYKEIIDAGDSICQYCIMPYASYGSLNQHLLNCEKFKLVK